MSARQQQFSGSGAVRQGHELDLNRLQEYLQGVIPGFAGPLTIRQFKGGQSNPTYLLDASSGCYVMRRKPPGKLLKSAHAVDREYRVLSALHASGFPVPKPLVLCEDDDVAGTMFYIMEYVAGRVFWDLDLPGLDPDERRAIYDHVNRTIADLHNLDHVKIGLADYGKPGNYFARQISRWSKQYALSETGKVDAMDRLIEWLPQNIPDDDSSGVVHGDYRLDNLILHPTEPRVIAVLDWELSTIGHPLGDFTYHLMSWQMPDLGIGSAGLRNADLKSLGIPTEDEYVAQYCERTGRKGGIPHRDFYAAYNFFRIAAILQGIAGRVRDGTAASAHAEKTAKAVAPLADMGWSYARKAA
ncbi:MAG: phosphotransferase family protein [Gammaproteobacteria bacterium]|nr:phosphotransferase family protein [Gammaproteobacteria bacterium]MDH4314632.1 phosphotransferase family protein [Gammaproteobacteria bacterium]MDH5212868.1 phosphotransferase family protein [Gammaproteobacteria bacterium]MDH5499936.1 phosphotransferase family protein [Gammaproteobacteria bacterium]